MAGPGPDSVDLKKLKHYYDLKDGKSADCMLCPKHYLTKDGCTTALHYHLEHAHGIFASKRRRGLGSGTEVEPQTKKRNLGEELANEQSYSAIISRMTAKSGLPFKVFQTDVDLRLCIQARLEQLGKQQELHKTDKTIKSYVMTYCEKVRNSVRKSLRLLKVKGKNFSIDCDEWTSVANRRYMNVSIFTDSEMFWCLGLIPITGHATAERLKELVVTRLSEFGIDFDQQVVAITTDGAATMVKLGRNSTAEHQLCLIHGIQLAVLDTLYKGQETSDNETENTEYNNCESTNDTDEEDLDSEFEVLESNVNVEFNNSKIKHTINKIRKLGASFKRSALNNEILQSYIQTEFKDPKLKLSMLIDTRTRWNSMYFMLDRYWTIKNCVDKTLIDIKAKITVTAEDKYIVSCVLKTLKPVMSVVKFLSRRDSNLVRARTALMMLFSQLQTHKNPLTKYFLRRLHCRIEERWTINASLLFYLETCSYVNSKPKPCATTEDKDYDFVFENEHLVFSECYLTNESGTSKDVFKIFDIPKKTVLTGHVVSLVKRLFPPPVSETPAALCTGEDQVSMKEKTFEELLEEAVNQVGSKIIPEANKNSELGKAITSEMNHFEKSGNRGFYLKNIYNCLSTIKPSSVESERAFSAAAQVCTKVRSRLNDNTLDSLCFLRSFFRNPYVYDD